MKGITEKIAGNKTAKITAVLLLILLVCILLAAIMNGSTKVGGLRIKNIEEGNYSLHNSTENISFENNGVTNVGKAYLEIWNAKEVTKENVQDYDRVALIAYDDGVDTAPWKNYSEEEIIEKMAGNPACVVNFEETEEWYCLSVINSVFRAGKPAFPTENVFTVCLIQKDKRTDGLRYAIQLEYDINHELINQADFEAISNAVYDLSGYRLIDYDEFVLEMENMEISGQDHMDTDGLIAKEDLIFYDNRP